MKSNSFKMNVEIVLRHAALLAIILLGCMPTMTSAQVLIEGVYYNLDKNTRTASVAQNPDFYQGDVIIQESFIDNRIKYKVTSIGPRAFKLCSDLTSVEIPNSVTSIGEHAFWKCSGLTSIEIPNSVTSIDEGAFVGCININSINLPNSLTSIGWSLFSGCTGLTSISIPNSVTEIGPWAFNYCSGLKSIEIPNSVISIDQQAFQGCSGLTSLKLSNGLTSVGIAAFRDCSGLTSIEIPNSVTSIGEGAFYGCTGLTSVIVPSSVTSIGGGAFNSCNLVSITVDESNPMYKSVDGVLLSKDGTTLLIYPQGKTDTAYIIPNSVTSIDQEALECCDYLTSITIGDNVTFIGDLAFNECHNLTTVFIGKSVTYVGNGAFLECSSLSDVYCYAENVPKTGYDIFDDSNYRSATLHVPAASISSYQAARYWNGCKEIVALTGQMSGDNLSMVVEGRKWNVVTINPAYPSEATNGYYDVLGRRGKVWGRYTYVLEGDTVIGGITYKRLLSDGKYVCGLREEDGRVYKRGNNSEGLLYDFNAQPGDIFKNDECSWMQVGQVRQVSVKGQNRRCLDMYYYSCIGDPEEGEELVVIGGYYVADYWIEGIGCTGYPHNLFWFDIIGNYPLLVSVYDGDKCIFDIEEFGSIVATSVRDIPKATNERNISPDAPIYDLQGRRLSAAPQKGVYIQNGKKKLVK